MTKRELIEALEALDCSDDTEVQDEAGYSISFVQFQTRYSEVPYIEVS